MWRIALERPHHLSESQYLLRVILNDALRFLAQIDEDWRDCRDLLNTLTPDIMRADAEVFRRLLECPDLKERDQISDSMTIRKLFPGWFASVSPTCLLLAYLSLAFDRPSLIPEYLAVTELPGQGHIMLPKTRELVEPLTAHCDNRR